MRCTAHGRHRSLLGPDCLLGHEWSFPLLWYCDVNNAQVTERSPLRYHFLQTPVWGCDQFCGFPLTTRRSTQQSDCRTCHSIKVGCYWGVQSLLPPDRCECSCLGRGSNWEGWESADWWHWLAYGDVGFAASWSHWQQSWESARSMQHDC